MFGRFFGNRAGARAPAQVENGSWFEAQAWVDIGWALDLIEVSACVVVVVDDIRFWVCRLAGLCLWG